MIRSIFVWYLPQSAFFVLGMYTNHISAIERGEPVNVAVGIFGGILLAAAYTGGANLAINSVARFRRRFGLPAQGRKTGGDGHVTAVKPALSLRESTQERGGFRIGQDRG